MINVSVELTDVSAKRFWDTWPNPLPVTVKCDLNLTSVEKNKNGHLDVPFDFTVNYEPSVGMMRLKGKAIVEGSKEKLEKIYKDYKLNKDRPAKIAQSISSLVVVEALLLSKTLNLPYPIPLPSISTTC